MDIFENQLLVEKIHSYYKSIEKPSRRKETMDSKTHQTSPRVHLFELDDFESLPTRVTVFPTVECGDAAFPLYRTSLDLSISHAVALKLGKRKRIRILTNDERRPGRWPGRPFRR